MLLALPIFVPISGQHHQGGLFPADYYSTDQHFYDIPPAVRPPSSAQSFANGHLPSSNRRSSSLSAMSRSMVTVLAAAFEEREKAEKNEPMQNEGHGNSSFRPGQRNSRESRVLEYVQQLIAMNRNGRQRRPRPSPSPAPQIPLPPPAPRMAPPAISPQMIRRAPLSLPRNNGKINDDMGMGMNAFRFLLEFY